MIARVCVGGWHMVEAGGLRTTVLPASTLLFSSASFALQVYGISHFYFPVFRGEKSCWGGGEVLLWVIIDLSRSSAG